LRFNHDFRLWCNLQHWLGNGFDFGSGLGHSFNHNRRNICNNLNLNRSNICRNLCWSDRFAIGCFGLCRITGPATPPTATPGPTLTLGTIFV
jgi:hypothetical protein